MRELAPRGQRESRNLGPTPLPSPVLSFAILCHSFLGISPLPDLIVVNDRSEKNATEQLIITRKTVLIDTGGDGGGTDVSDYGRAEEDLGRIV